MDVKKLIVVGAGPTAIGLINALLMKTKRVRPNHILVVDPQEPMAQFGQHVSNIGMQDMRSPWSVDVTGASILQAFAARQEDPYRYNLRPNWNIFRQHALSVWTKLGVPQMNLSAVGISKSGQNWIVQLSDGSSVSAKRLVIATGFSAHRIKPFEYTIPIPDQPLGDHHRQQVALIGAGMTATNAAFTLMEQGARVTLFTPPSALKVEHSHLNRWISGPESDGACISQRAEESRTYFIKQPLRERYSDLRTQRIEGTVTRDHILRLENLEQVGFLTRIGMYVESVIGSQEDRAVVTGRGESRKEHGPFSAVYDARGFQPSLDNLMDIQGLREIVGDNRLEQYPLIDDNTGAVKNVPGLYFAGALSAMSFGPAANTVAAGNMLGYLIAKNL